MTPTSNNATSNPRVIGFDRQRFVDAADWLMVAVAVSLPWSTSATAILVVVWLAAVIPTLRWEVLRGVVSTAAGGLPALLVLLGILGMLWADVSLLERWKGLDSFLKLLVLPLILAAIERPERAHRVFAGYLISCAVLLLASYVLVVWPGFPLQSLRDDYVPVKNAATQSGEFVTCIFGLLYLAHAALGARQWLRCAAFAAIALAMLANIVFLANGRTALVVLAVLLVLFALTQLTARGMAGLFAIAVILGATAWLASPYLRSRVEHVWTDYQKYKATDARNSSGERIVFDKKSIAFIREAPIFGHGTGTITSLFRKSTAGKTGAEGRVTTNPHNQTFAVGIQLGLVGMAVLWAMWIAHLLLFRGAGLIAWVGFVLVTQNIVGSLFNSHLFDFLQGWTYVIGVGVAGAITLRRRAVRRAAP